jgi:hypothetical protein
MKAMKKVAVMVAGLLAVLSVAVLLFVAEDRKVLEDEYTSYGFFVKRSGDFVEVRYRGMDFGLFDMRIIGFRNPVRPHKGVELVLERTDEQIIVRVYFNRFLFLWDEIGKKKGE